MSEVSHSDELVTKQDLSNFYQGILPYLGGMPEMLANKFNKSDLYSSEEKIVGRWTDGKPLYQKTIVTTDLPSNGGAYIPHGITNMDTVCDVKGMLHEKASVISFTWTPIPRVQDNSTTVNMAIDVLDKYILLKGRTFDATAIFDKAHITLQYTKTTDSAVNIGSEGDYSTTEKIVGTWIDGKPIYQKTMIVKAPNVTTQGTQAQTSTPHNISNIKSRLGCGFMGSANVQIFGSANSTYYMSAYFDTTNLYIRANNNTWNNTNVTVTMRYTKTTD